MLSRYAPSVVSNLRYKLYRFVTGVANLVKEKCRMTMLHDDMNLSRIMVYSQSIEESKLNRINRNLKRSGTSEQNQSGFKKRVQI